MVALTGRIDFADGPGVDLTAETAALDLERQVMTLAGAVRAVTTDGYDFAADEVDVDLQAGGLRARGSVSGVGPMGRIVSDRLTIATPEGGGGQPNVFVRRPRAAGIRSAAHGRLRADRCAGRDLLR